MIDNKVKTFTKESLIESLIEIRERGWIPGSRAGNHGDVGNTLEDLLGIEENNLPIPNAAEWELKTNREKSSALQTLFHVEPSPRALGFVPQILLPKFGWPHKDAGIKYPPTEMSFRQTIHSGTWSSRGFKVHVDENEEKICVKFDPNQVSPILRDWKEQVFQRTGAYDINENPPYWGFDDLYHKAGVKLHNCFFISADEQKFDGITHYKYNSIKMMRGFSKERFIQAFRDSHIYVDFDARTGHNHGTKFRYRKKLLPSLYDEVIEF